MPIATAPVNYTAAAESHADTPWIHAANVPCSQDMYDEISAEFGEYCNPYNLPEEKMEASPRTASLPVMPARVVRGMSVMMPPTLLSIAIPKSVTREGSAQTDGSQSPQAIVVAAILPPVVSPKGSVVVPPQLLAVLPGVVTSEGDVVIAAPAPLLAALKPLLATTVLNHSLDATLLLPPALQEIVKKIVTPPNGRSKTNSSTNSEKSSSPTTSDTESSDKVGRTSRCEGKMFSTLMDTTDEYNSDSSNEFLSNADLCKNMFGVGETQFTWEKNMDITGGLY